MKSYVKVWYNIDSELRQKGDKMNGFYFAAVWIFGVISIAVIAKTVIYCGTLAYYQARHAFFSKILKKKNNGE